MYEYSIPAAVDKALGLLLSEAGATGTIITQTDLSNEKQAKYKKPYDEATEKYNSNNKYLFLFCSICQLISSQTISRVLGKSINAYHSSKMKKTE